PRTERANPPLVLFRCRSDPHRGIRAERLPTRPTCPSLRALLERIPEAHHHHVNVAEGLADARRGLERLAEQRRTGRGVHRGEVVREPPLTVRGWIGQNPVLDDRLPDAPVVIQQIPEVGDVETDLPGMPMPRDAVE